MDRLFGSLACFFLRHKPKFITYNSYPGNGVWQYGCDRCNLLASGFYLRQRGYNLDDLHNRNKESDNG